MNVILIRILSTMNGALAFIIIFACTLAGFSIVYSSTILSIIGGIFGALIGLLIAAVICGLIAFLTLIEHHLSVIAAQKTKHVEHSKA